MRRKRDKVDPEIQNEAIQMLACAIETLSSLQHRAVFGSRFHVEAVQVAKGEMNDVLVAIENYSRNFSEED